MRKILHSLVIVLLVLSCKKSTSPIPSPSVANSQWIIEKDTVKGNGVYEYNLIFNGLSGYTDANSMGSPYGRFVQIGFNYEAGKPAKSGAYMISSASVVPPNSNECLLYAGNTECCQRYFSNVPGQKLTVTVSARGKIDCLVFRYNNNQLRFNHIDIGNDSREID